METNDRSTFDLQALVQRYVDDLRAAAQSPQRDAPVPSAGTEQLRQAARQVQTERRDAVATLNAQYEARTTAMEAVVIERQRRLEAYAQRQRQAVPAAPDRFVVAGRVTDRVTGRGLPHVRVRAMDLDRRHDDLLGEVRTDALGYYRIAYTSADIAERDENPETYIEVLDNESQVLFTSTKSFIQKAGRSAFIPATVDGNKLPTAKRMAGKVAGSVARRQQNLTRRRRTLQYRPSSEIVMKDEDAARLAPPARPVAPPHEKAPAARPEAAQGDEGVEPASEEPRSTSSHRPLTAVKGIGAVYQERLSDAGITTIEAVAKMKPARLAAILEVGAGRAQRIVGAAREFVPPETNGNEA